MKSTLDDFQSEEQSRDTRNGRTVRDLLRHFPETFAAGLFWTICGLLGPETAGRFGGLVGSLIGRFSRRTAIVRRNLEVAFPKAPAAEIDRLVKSVWRNAGTVFGEYPHLAGICDPSSGRVQVSVHPDAQIGGNTVFLAPHVGNWEVSAVAAPRRGTPMTVVYSPRPNQAINDRLSQFRRALGVRVIPRDSSGLALFRELRRGHAIGLLADRRDGKGGRVPFFGQMRSVSLVPAMLALKSGASLATAHVRREGPARYRVHVDPPVADTMPDAPLEARALAMMQEISRRYEAHIREAPGDWFCMNRLWNKKITGKPRPTA